MDAYPFLSPFFEVLQVGASSLERFNIFTLK